jgi:hypothetical protein
MVARVNHVLTTLPLPDLVLDGVKYQRGAYLDREAVLTHLRADDPAIAIAAIGNPIRTASGTDAYALWKAELAGRPAEGDRLHLEDFAEGRA